VYISRLRKKLERDPAAPEYLHTVRGVGYVFRPTPRANVTQLDPILAARDNQASAISAG